MVSSIANIISTDGRMEMVATTTHITLRAAAALREALQQEINRQMQSIDPMIQAGKYVADSLSGLMAMSEHIIECPIADIAGIDYTDGAIHFTYAHQPEFLFEDVTVGDGPQMVAALRMFTSEDAASFVAAVSKILNKGEYA